MSNSDYIIGKTWGITKVFIGLNIITLAITAFFNIFINQSPFDVFPYLFYLLTISIPSLIFVLGLSFTVMCLVKNQAITFLILLGIIGTIFFKLSQISYGVFDFFGVHIPTIFSDIIGHINLNIFLLQRGIYLLAGISLICFTIALVKRLPQNPRKLILLHSFGAFLLIGAFFCGGFYVNHYTHRLGERNEYIVSFNQYAQVPKATILEHNLTVTPSHQHLKGTSILKIVNRNHSDLKQLVLYLNPTLDILSIESDQQALPFKRENQIILINTPLASQEERVFTINYAGKIDETICYTDVSDSSYLDNSILDVPYQWGKRYAWLEDQFTLLTPECIWYPVSEPPVNPASPYQIQKNFTRYQLTVNYTGEKTVLSQGECQNREGKISFTSPKPLPGISLTIADYEKKTLQIDTVNYMIYHFKGHDFFSKYFSNIKDTIAGEIREIKNSTEVTKGRDYPFHKFILAETPIQFASYIRNWKGYTEYIMPEIVFIPEKAVTLNFDFASEKARMIRWSNYRGVMSEEEMELSILRNFIQRTFMSESNQQNFFDQNKSVNPYNINSLFFNHTNFIYSEDYPVMDIVLNIMQNTTSSSNPFARWGNVINDEQRANLYLENHSFKTALSDITIKPTIFYELLKLKSNALKNYINTQMPPEYFTEFVDNFFKKHQFISVSFDTFIQELEYEYGVNLRPFLSSWYLDNQTPTFFVKDVDANQVVVEEVTKYQVKFKIYNSSDVDGIITVNIQQGGGFGGGFGGRGGGFGGGGFSSSNEAQQETYVIPANQAREIKIIEDQLPASVKINMNIAHNLPASHTTRFAKIETVVTDTMVGTFPISPDLFKPDPNEIIIDNEDINFKTISSNNKHKLKDLFQQEDNQKYHNFTPWFQPSKWTAFVADYCYGATINSAVYKKKGNGNNSVQWTADIPQNSYYELFIWNPKNPMSRRMGRPRQGEENEKQEGQNQTYTISYGDETESITIDLLQGENDWISLGNFYLPKGVTTVTLTDKVTGQYVIADAIKFTRVIE